MPSKMYKTGDEYAAARDLQLLRVQLREAKLSIPIIAYELRMSPSHTYALINGRSKMAHHVLLAIRFVLLQHVASMRRAAKAVQDFKSS